MLDERCVCVCVCQRAACRAHAHVLVAEHADDVDLAVGGVEEGEVDVDGGAAAHRAELATVLRGQHRPADRALRTRAGEGASVSYTVSPPHKRHTPHNTRVILHGSRRTALWAYQSMETSTPFGTSSRTLRWKLASAEFTTCDAPIFFDTSRRNALMSERRECVSDFGVLCWVP